MLPHRGNPLLCLKEGLSSLELPATFTLAVTGQGCEGLLHAAPQLRPIEEVPAVMEGARFLVPEGGSLFEIGSQNVLFVHDLQAPIPKFATNEQCAGGTGSFLRIK